MSDAEKLTRGWVFLTNSPKWHYMVDGKSLCGKWMYFGSSFEEGNDNSPDNCKGCLKKLRPTEAKTKEISK